MSDLLPASEKIEKPLLTRVFETAIITGVSVIVAGVVGSAVAFMWSKAINVENLIRTATENIEATQVVYGEAIEKNTKSIIKLTEEIEALRKNSYPESEVYSMSPDDELAPPQTKAAPKILPQDFEQRIPVQEALRSYKN